MSAAHRKSGNRVYTVNCHFVFCPKYRRKCLVGPVKGRIDVLVREKSTGRGGEVVALEVMPDHIHLFVAVTPDLAPNHIIAQVKGVTCRLCRQEFPHRLKMPSLWTRGYFVSALGHVSDSVVRAYIENQKGM